MWSRKPLYHRAPLTGDMKPLFLHTCSIYPAAAMWQWVCVGESLRTTQIPTHLEPQHSLRETTPNIKTTGPAACSQQHGPCSLQLGKQECVVTSVPKRDEWENICAHRLLGTGYFHLHGTTLCLEVKLCIVSIAVFGLIFFSTFYFQTLSL